MSLTVKPRRRNRYALAPAVMLSASLLLFALFFLWPGGLGLIYSFTDYSGFGSSDFVGVDNYTRLLSDPEFYSSLLRTFLFAALAVPLVYVTSLGVAALLVAKYSKGTSVAKIIFFLPWLISPIVTGVIWRWLFGESFGFVNFVIETLGGKSLPWSSDGTLALLIVVAATAWGSTAFNMLLFIAALRNVPMSYYEAAQLDGASAWQRFIHITLPSIAPTSVLVVLLTTINSMREFALVQTLTNGGPGTENTFVVQYIYKAGFERADIGFASAASMVLMVILLVIALIQLRVSRATEESQ